MAKNSQLKFILDFSRSSQPNLSKKKADQSRSALAGDYSIVDKRSIEQRRQSNPTFAGILHQTMSPHKKSIAMMPGVVD